MAQTASNVSSAKEKLYGPGRLLNTARAAQRMQKSSLIKKGEPYDNDKDLESITALSFRVRPHRWSVSNRVDHCTRSFSIHRRTLIQPLPNGPQQLNKIQI